MNMRASLLTAAAVAGFAAPVSAQAGYRVYSEPKTCFTNLSNCAQLGTDGISSTTSGKIHEPPYVLFEDVVTGGVDVGKFWFCSTDTCYWYTHVDEISDINKDPWGQLAHLDVNDDGYEDLILVQTDGLYVFFGPQVLGSPHDSSDAHFIPAPAQSVGFGADFVPQAYSSFDALWVIDANNNWYPYWYGNVKW